MYWNYKSIPELADLPPKERDAIWHEAKRDPFRVTDVAWFAFFMLIVGCMAVCLVPLMHESVWGCVAAMLASIFAGDLIMNAFLVLRYRPVVGRLRRGG